MAEQIRELTCIGCPLGCTIMVTMNDKEILSVTGNTCKRGDDYARNEVIAPKRTVTTTVKLTGGRNRVVPVKTKGDIPKEDIFKCIEELSKITLTSPVAIGQVVVENVCNSGVDVVVTQNM